MSKVTFSEFAKALGPLIAQGKSDGAFVKWLFEQIASFENEDQNPIHNRNESTYRHYYYGSRGISRIASKLCGHLDKEKFATSIEDFSTDTQDKIYEALSSFWPEMTAVNMTVDAANLFEKIIIDASKVNRSKKDAKKESEEARYLQNEVLLNETACRCANCNKRLVRSVKGRTIQTFVPTRIIPSSADYTFKKRCEEAGFEYPAPSSLANLLAMCPQCAAEYEADGSFDAFMKLVKKKQQFQRWAELADTLDRLDIEDGIIDLLDNLARIGQEFDYSEATKNAIEITKKISPEEQLLANEVCDNVTRYYHFVQEQFKQLDSQGVLDFEMVRNQMRGCFLHLAKSGLPQNKIVDTMAAWLGTKTGCESAISCRIVIAFFIQTCEVFHEITE